MMGASSLSIEGGRSNPSVTSRYSSLLRSVSADVRSSGDVIATHKWLTTPILSPAVRLYPKISTSWVVNGWFGIPVPKVRGDAPLFATFAKTAAVNANEPNILNRFMI